MPSRVASLFVFGVLSIGTLAAQDTRTVVEPRFPDTCASLKAKIVAKNGSIPDADETRSDTGRLQKAIDGCSKGKAVELISDGSYNAFLSGPLKIKEGVALLIQSGTTLFASRDAREFD